MNRRRRHYSCGLCYNIQTRLAYRDGLAANMFIYDNDRKFTLARDSILNLILSYANIDLSALGIIRPTAYNLFGSADIASLYFSAYLELHRKDLLVNAALFVYTVSRRSASSSICLDISHVEMFFPTIVIRFKPREITDMKLTRPLKEFGTGRWSQGRAHAPVSAVEARKSGRSHVGG